MFIRMLRRRGRYRVLNLEDTLGLEVLRVCIGMEG